MIAKNQVLKAKDYWVSSSESYAQKKWWNKITRIINDSKAICLNGNTAYLSAQNIEIYYLQICSRLWEKQ